LNYPEVIKMQSTVTVRGQTAIPAAIRRRYNIKAKTKIEWIDDGHTITVMPIPQDPIKALKGRYKNIDLLQALLKSRKEERKRA
jgi:AbrB family looped-hinge helix DNA binding protein